MTHKRPHKALSIYDLAQDLGVSSGTVSRAFNNHPEVSKATKEKVLRRAKELGYNPSPLARGLARNVVQAIGIVIPTIYDPFFLDFAEGVQTVASEANVSVMMSFTDYRAETLFSAVQSFQQFRVAGIVLMGGSGQRDTELAEMLARTPTVVALRRATSPAFPAVFVDHESGAYEMTRLLAARSARRIAYVSLPLATQAALERLEGFRRGLAASGGVDRGFEFFAEGNGFLDGVAAARALLADPRSREIGAIFFASDALATGGLSALAEAGFAVPDDVKVAGFGDIASSSVTRPSLTTVHVPMREIGERSFRLLLARIAGTAPEAEQIMLASQITERGST